jgi:hypothetical protein
MKQNECVCVYAQRRVSSSMLIDSYQHVERSSSEHLRGRGSDRENELSGGAEPRKCVY